MDETYVRVKGAWKYLYRAVERRSDKTNERTWHIVTACVLVAFGVVLSANTLSSALALAGMACIIMGSWSAIAVFWTQPTTFLTGVAAAGAVALINSVLAGLWPFHAA
jgi:ACS family tartrate transporter-like MFS transporter